MRALELKIIKKKPRHSYQLYCADGLLVGEYYMITSKKTIIENLFYTDSRLYAPLPDGRWYSLYFHLSFSSDSQNDEETIVKLIQSGIEPYRALEIIAL